MTDQRDFSQRTDPSGTSYPSLWIESYERALANRPEDGGAGPRMTIADVLNGDRFALAAQPDPAAVMVVPTNRSGTKQVDGPGAQPRPDGSGVSLVTDPEPFPDGRKRDAREVQAANEGPTPSFYKNG
jgi:hypothetical protein